MNPDGQNKQPVPYATASAKTVLASILFADRYEVRPAQLAKDIGADLSLFWSTTDRNLFKAFKEILDAQEALTPEAAALRTGENVSDLLALSDLAMPNRDFLAGHVATLRADFQRRQALVIAAQLEQAARDVSADLAVALLAIRADVDALTASGPKTLEKELGACVIDLKGLFSLTLPERKAWFPWLPEGALVMVYGQRGIGKTFFSLSSAVSLACGSPFLRWAAPEHPVGVLYVDGEMPLGAMRQRVADLMQNPAADGLLRFLPGEHVYNSTKRDLRLSDPRVREAVSRIVDATPEVRVVVLDNISCLFSGMDEDKKRDWEQVVPWLLSLRHRGVAVILVHHAGKGGDQRGTSGREDLLDTVIRLDRPHDARAEDGARFVVRFTKSRGVTGEAVSDFEASLVKDEAGSLTWTWRPVQESNLDRLLQAVSDGVELQADLPDELGLTKGAVSKLVKKARDLGHLAPGDRRQPLRLTGKLREAER